MVRKKNDYHLLVAQNFLSNISIDGTHNDTKLHIFSTKGLTKGSCDKKVSRDLTSPSLKLNESAVSIGTTSTSIPQELFDDHRLYKDTPPKKKSLFRRLAKIVSSDDVICTMTASSSKAPILEEHISREEIAEYVEVPPESPTLQPNLSANQFSFLKRLKSTITHVDRWYVCSEPTKYPLAVFSYLPTGSNYIDPLSTSFGNTIQRGKSKRSKSIFGSADRIRHHHHLSSEELRPFIFRDPEEYISLGVARRKRNPSPFFTLFDKPKKDRRESFREPSEDIFSESIDIPQSVFNRESSSEKGTSLEERADDLVNIRIEDTDVVEDYDPQAFDELASGKRTVIRLNCFIGSTVHFQQSDRAKTTMNESFVEKFPHIHLTLSKFKSIKREMLKLAEIHSIDHHTLACSYVYFEKVVSQGLISKDNRKCVAGASLLVAMKMNDYSKATIREYIDQAEDQLRESKSDILSYELPLCSALKFKLVPILEELEPHLDKLQFEMY